MTSKAPRPLSRTQPDGTRWKGIGENDVVTGSDEISALRDALDVILSTEGRESDSGEKGGANILGTSDAIVSAVAHVVRRAHEVLHEREDLSETRQRRCAEVLFNALPESVSRRIILADAIAQVRFLARERDIERAIGPATAALLGWTEVAARAIAQAVNVVVSRSRE